MIITTVLAGCSTNGGSNSSSKSANTSSTNNKQSASTEQPADQSGPYAERLSIKWLGFNEQGHLPKDDTLIEKIIEERYNIDIENVKVDTYNKEQVNIYFASGDEADVIYYVGTSLQQMVDSGVIRSVPFEWMEQYAPSIVKSLNKNVPQELWLKQVSIDDQFYAIPTLSTTWLTPRVMVMRKDWMEAVGVSEVPTTLQALEELLIKIRTNDPDGNGLKDTYALNKFSSTTDAIDLVNPYIFGMYGVRVGFWHEEAGNLIHASVHPGFKEGLKVLNDWYKKEIFDPEIVLDDRPKLISKFENGTVGGFFEQDSWLDPGNQAAPLFLLKQKNPNAEYVFIPPVAGENGVAATSTMNTNPVGAPGLFFGANTSDEKVIRILRMLNDVYSDPELLALVEFGLEGEHYTIDENGYYNPVEGQFSQEAITERGARRFYLRNFLNDLAIPMRLVPSRMGVYDEIKDFPTVDAPLYQPVIDSEYKQALDDITKEYFWKAVVGQEDVDATWDQYVDRWMKAGGTAATEKANAEYKEVMQ